jgi:hypothetical protein
MPKIKMEKVTGKGKDKETHMVEVEPVDARELAEQGYVEVGRKETVVPTAEK